MSPSCVGLMQESSLDAELLMPGLLSSTDPGDLLDRVEAFLATERGQRILLSGTSYELSRNHELDCRGKCQYRRQSLDSNPESRNPRRKDQSEG